MAISSALGGTVGSVPVGSVTAFAGSTAPSGWLLCYGQAVSRSAYGQLYSVISTTYGTGDGSSTFNLPDLRGRVPAGKDDMGGSATGRITSGGSGFFGTVLGQAGGAETHTLTSAQMPSHTHTQDSHNHNQNPHSHTQTAHQHALNVARATANAYLDTGSYWAGGTSLNNEGYAYTSYANGWTGYGGYLTSEAPNINSTAATNIAYTATNQNTGGGGAHNNVQPTLILNYIIKAF